VTVAGVHPGLVLLAARRAADPVGLGAHQRVTNVFTIARNRSGLADSSYSRNKPAGSTLVGTVIALVSVDCDLAVSKVSAMTFFYLCALPPHGRGQPFGARFHPSTRERDLQSHS
jgi:hypothetical protein